MKKRFLSLLTALLLLITLILPVSARGNIKLSNVRFRLGSLIADGSVKALGNTQAVLVLDSKGVAVITCSKPGNDDVSGRTDVTVTASGQTNLFHDDDDDNDRSSDSDNDSKNGKTPFSVETVDPETLPWDVAGCPDSDWTAHIDFIAWTKATISIYNAPTNDSLRTNSSAALLTQDYKCKTTQDPAKVSCKPIKHHDDDEDNHGR